MAILAAVDGDEVDETIPPLIANMIQTAGHGMLSAFGGATKSLENLSVSPDVVGKDASVVLIQWRTAIVLLLLVFRDYVLPSSQRCVNDVEKTLRTYFGPNSTLHQFKQLLPNLKARLGPRIKGARDAKSKIVLMSSDLINLSRTLDGEQQSVKLQLEEALKAKGKDASKAMEAAERATNFGRAGSVTTMLGTVALAKGLITTGGMIVGIPALAPVVLAAGLYFANLSKEEASTSAARHGKDEEKFNAMCQQIKRTLDSVDDLNDNCLVKLSGCLQKFGDFFTHIQSQLEQMSDPDCEIGDPDAVLNTFHSQLKDQAREVIGACSQFNSYCTRVEIAVQVLDQFKPDDSTEFVADWIERANAEVERTSK